MAVAGLALWFTWRERRERLQESRRAKLKGYIAHPDGNKWYLVLHNYGDAAATNIEVWINDVDLPNHPLIARNKKLELSTPIGPYTDVRYLLTRGLNLAETIVLKLNWQDASGKPGEYRSRLTF
jgi:hypothetical protein